MVTERTIKCGGHLLYHFLWWSLPGFTSSHVFLCFSDVISRVLTVRSCCCCCLNPSFDSSAKTDCYCDYFRVVWLGLRTLCDHISNRPNTNRFFMFWLCRVFSDFFHRGETTRAERRNWIGSSRIWGKSLLPPKNLAFCCFDKHRNKSKQHTMSQTSNDPSSIFTFTSTPSKTTPPLFKPRKPSSSSSYNNSTNELLKRQIHQLKRRVKEQENELSSCYRQLNKMNCTIAGKQLAFSSLLIFSRVLLESNG